MTEYKLMGVPKLMHMALLGEDMSAIGEELNRRITENSLDANALLDSATYLILGGNLKEGLAIQELAIKTRQVYEYPREACKSPVKLLTILGPGDLMANSPLEFLIEGQSIALDLLYITAEIGFPKEIPEHDILMVAVAESDDNKDLLDYLSVALKNWPKPVLNKPERIAGLSREVVFEKLSNLPGVTIPATTRIKKLDIERWLNLETESFDKEFILPGEKYPIIIRPIDSHAGLGLEKIENENELKEYIDISADEGFFVSRFVDYTSDDGKYRKYRLILIDGRPCLCHMAISSRWMVHYLNSDMLKSLEHRNEEKECMENFDETFAVRHKTALENVTSSFGLDYFGIDCAEAKDGQLLVFEVDSNMVVHNMDSDDIFSYKKVPMRKIFKEFSQLLESRKLTC